MVEYCRHFIVDEIVESCDFILGIDKLAPLPDIIPYMSPVIGRIYLQQECHSVLAKLHPITFYRIVFLGCAQFLG